MKLQYTETFIFDLGDIPIDWSKVKLTEMTTDAQRYKEMKITFEGGRSMILVDYEFISSSVSSEQGIPLYEQ
jgi:hypothetical protein